MALLKQLKDIPTVAYLYRTKVIKPSSNPHLPVGNQEYNDKICTIQHDLTELEVDAIVNAANSRLLGGGGVDGAIHRAAGRGLLAECKTLNGCATGSAKITDAYDLPCKKVIHAVGPIYKDQEHSEPLLRGCYRTALQLAVDNDCRSIAFAAVSTGIYGYPSPAAAKAALREVMAFLRRPEGKKLDKIVFCSFLDKDVRAYAQEIPEVFPPTEQDLSEAVSASMELQPSLEAVQEEEKRQRAPIVQAGLQAWSFFSIGDGDKGVEENQRESVSLNATSRAQTTNGQEIPSSEREAVGKTTSGQKGEGELELCNFGNEPIGGNDHRHNRNTDTVLASRIHSDRSGTSVDNKSFHDANNIVAIAPSFEQGRDNFRDKQPIDTSQTESDDGEWRDYSARSRPTSAIELKDQIDPSAIQAQKIMTPWVTGMCEHIWVMDKSLNLWPQGRHKCANCGVVMGWSRVNWTVAPNAFRYKVSRKAFDF